MEGIKANGIHSYYDLGFCIAERNIGIAKKKSIKKEIPYMNGAYDFSRISGEDIYEENIIRYVFDIAELSAEKMERKKDLLLQWLSDIYDTDIEDDFIPEYKFHGSTETMDWEEDFGEGHLTVNFKVYPFKIAKALTKVELTGAGKVVNTSAHPVFPILILDKKATVTVNGKSYGIEAGRHEITQFALQRGVNTFSINPAGTLIVAYREERL